LLLQFIACITSSGEYKRYFIYDEEQIKSTYAREMNSLLSLHNKINSTTGKPLWPAFVFDKNKLQEHIENNFKISSPIKDKKTNKIVKIPNHALWYDKKDNPNVILFWGNSAEFYLYDKSKCAPGEMQIIDYCEKLIKCFEEIESTDINITDRVIKWATRG